MERRALARLAEKALNLGGGDGAQTLLELLGFPELQAVALVMGAMRVADDPARALRARVVRWVSIVPDCEHGPHANVWEAPPEFGAALRHAGFLPDGTDGEAWVYCAGELAYERALN